MAFSNFNDSVVGLLRERCRASTPALTVQTPTRQAPAGSDRRLLGGVDLRSKARSPVRTFRTTSLATTPGFSDAAPEAVLEHRRVSDPSQKVWDSNTPPLSSPLLGSITLTG